MKKVIKSNYRVVITPRGPGNYGFASVSPRLVGYDTPEKISKYEKDTCEEILHDVKRHVDNIGYISIESDTDTVCSFCGLLWEVSTDNKDPDFPVGTPFCCRKAIDHFKNNIVV